MSYLYYVSRAYALCADPCWVTPNFWKTSLIASGEAYGGTQGVPKILQVKAFKCMKVQDIIFY